MNFYNDNDPKAAAWLRELISDGLIPPGDVSEKSITEIKGDELVGYTQCHFFAGIGGWSLALKLAGWPEDVPVWTGSCPCQPFSCAGKQLGTADERHLWPEFFRLISECLPSIVFGEQVAGAIGKGWLDGISADLERENYAVGAHVLGAHSVNAPHQRNRLYWLAYDYIKGLSGWNCKFLRERSDEILVGEGMPFIGLAYGDGERREEQQVCLQQGDARQADIETSGCGGTSGMEESTRERRGGRDNGDTTGDDRALQTSGYVAPDWNGETYWHKCLDGKFRRVPVEPALFPLAPRIPEGMGLLRGAGNAIVPQVAALFIKASVEAIGEIE